MSNYSDALFDAHQQIDEWKARYSAMAKQAMEVTEAAGELLRAAKGVPPWILSDYPHLVDAIAKAERAGIKS